MKIIQIFPGKVWGGAEQYVLDLGIALSAQGHDVSYLCRDVEAVTLPLTKAGVTFSPLPFSWGLDRKSISRLSMLMKDADIIHVHDIMFAPLAVLAKRRSGSKAKIVMTRHDAHRTPVNIFYRHLIKQIDCSIFVSDLARRAWCGANSWFPAEKCRVILNSIPSYKQIRMESLREKFNISSTTPLLLFCGRIKKTKGCDVLLKALGLLKDRDFEMVFIGKCNKTRFRNELDKIAKNAGITERVHYYGFSPNGRYFLPQADVAIAPSTGKEACPLSNLEAMQAGVCVIATTNGGQIEYLTNGETGMLVPPSDPQALANAIRQVLDDSDLRHRLAKEGQNYFLANMTYSQFINKIIDAYTEA